MKKRATRLDLANALAKKSGISVNKANGFMLEIVRKAREELIVNGNDVELFGVCKLYRKNSEGESLVSTGSLVRGISKRLNFSFEEAIMLESELSSIILDLLRNDFKVVITGLASITVENSKIRCASSASLRGSNNMTPCRVSLDRLFKRCYEEGIVL